MKALSGSTRFFLVVVLCALGGVRALDAACNVIPGPSQAYRGAIGTLDRPFASPGERVEIRLSELCDRDGNGDPQNFVMEGFEGVVEDLVISVLFRPPSGSVSAFVLASDCRDVNSDLQSCNGLAGRPSKCLPVKFATPINVDQPMTPILDPDVLVEARRLSFRFPDTDDLLLDFDDDLTLAGPAQIVVSRASAGWACSLATTRCVDETGSLACIDDLFQIPDESCAQFSHPTFGHFTALPPANNFQALCLGSPCATSSDADLRMTTDSDGNLLLPMDWSGVLPDARLRFSRLVRGRTLIPAFPNRGDPIEVPGEDFLESFAPEGGRLPPLFDPQKAPDEGASIFFGAVDAPFTVLRILRRLVDSGRCCDAPDRLCSTSDECASGTCGGSSCESGANDGAGCESDRECPGGTCGPSLFDFRSRYLSDVGPIVLSRFAGTNRCNGNAQAGEICLSRGFCQDVDSVGLRCADDEPCADGGTCVSFQMTAESPVSLAGLLQTEELLAFVVDEGVEGVHVNADDDSNDDVLLVFDRETGEGKSIGTGGEDGIAIVHRSEPPFRSPIVALEKDTIVFLQSEPAENGEDANDDGDVFDSILRIFRLEVDGELSGGAFPIDAAPMIDGRSIAISDGRVFFRSTERSACRNATTLVSTNANLEPANSDAGRAAISGDGRYVAFWSDATNLVPGVDIGEGQLFVHDRDADGNGFFDEPGGAGVSNTIVSISSAGELAKCGPPADFLFASGVAITSDGRFVAFHSTASNLVADDMDCGEQACNGVCGSDIFVHDRDADENGVFDEPGAVATVLASVLGNVPLGKDIAAEIGLSDDGRTVVFRSSFDVFVREMSAPESKFLERDANDNFPTSLAEFPALSPDGLVAAYGAFVVREDRRPGGTVEAFVRDRDPDGDSVPQDSGVASKSVSRTVEGTQSISISTTPALSKHGRFAAFASNAGDLVAGDTNGVDDYFVRDVREGITTRISVSSDGEQGDRGGIGSSGFLNNTAPAISHDGRYIVFSSGAGNLDPSDDNPGEDLFIHDRHTEMTTLASVLPSGDHYEAQRNRSAVVSADGASVVFESPRSADSILQVFVRGCDPSDRPGDLSSDGDFNDSVLQVLDLSAPSARVETLGPATAVSIFDRSVAFLVPESAIGAGASLNGDDDVADQVVHLATDGAAANLGISGSALSLSADWLVALVPEEGEGVDLNGDQDLADNVIHWHPVRKEGSWSHRSLVADTVQAAGGIIVFVTPEMADGNSPDGLNGDGDIADRVIGVLDLVRDRQLSITGVMGGRQAVEDFVLGPKACWDEDRGACETEDDCAGVRCAPTLIAFRTSEASQAQDLNGDSDMDDEVLQVFDLQNEDPVTSGQAVSPCRFEFCDPRIPYRVSANTVTFLTLESDQGDLNGDGDQGDLILQTLNTRHEGRGVLASQSRAGPELRRYSEVVAGGVLAGPLSLIGSVSVGVCSIGRQPCAGDQDCMAGDGACFLPPGVCVEDLGTQCLPRCSTILGQTVCVPDDCTGVPSDGLGEPYCRPNSEGTPNCHVSRTVSCGSNSDCDETCDTPGMCFCQEVDSPRKLVGPLSFAGRSGSLFPSAGRCVEETGQECPCEPGQVCGPNDVCERLRGTCRTRADCPEASKSRCRNDLLTVVATDSDLDEIPDAFDNCPTVANPKQADTNDDGIGDACDGGVAGKARLSRAADGRDVCEVIRPTPTPVVEVCAGDCGQDGRVAINELVVAVRIALGQLSVESCRAVDTSGDGTVSIDELVGAVRYALIGCG